MNKATFRGGKDEENGVVVNKSVKSHTCTCTFDSFVSSGLSSIVEVQSNFDGLDPIQEEL